MFVAENDRKVILGLIHLKPMPNTPFYKPGDLQISIDKAKRDALALLAGGANGALIQSVDKVYPAGDDTDYVRVAALAVIANEVRREVGAEFKIGVQLMWNCITPSLAVAKAAGADFTRCTALTGSTQSQFGVVEANPLKVMNYRRHIDAENIAMIAEVSGYHNHEWGVGGKEAVQKAVREVCNVGANAVEVYHPDEALNEMLVRTIKDISPDIPVVLGGGTNVTNVKTRMKYADAALVGSCFENGVWGADIVQETVRRYMGALYS